MAELIEIVKKLGKAIDSYDNVTIMKGIIELNRNLRNFDVSKLNEETVNLLVNFYVSIFDVHYDLLEHCFIGAEILIDFDNFTDKHAKYMAESIVKLTLQDYKKSVRILGFRILEHLIQFHLEELKTLGTEFIQNYLVASDAERTPEGVYLVMKINKFIVDNLNLNVVAQELFESIAIYFPLDVKENNKNQSISPTEIRKLLKMVLVGSPRFGVYLMPLLLEKCRSDIESHVSDTIDVLTASVDLMHAGDIEANYRSLLDSLFHIYTSTQFSFKEEVKLCLFEFGKCFENKFSDRKISEVANYLYQNLQSVYDEADEHSLHFLIAVLKGNEKVWKRAAALFIAELSNRLNNNKARNLSQLEALVKLLIVGFEFPETDLLTNGNMTELSRIIWQTIPDILDADNSKQNENLPLKICLVFNFLVIHGVYDCKIVNENTEEKSFVDFVKDDIINMGFKLINKFAEDKNLKEQLIQSMCNVVIKPEMYNYLIELLMETPENHLEILIMLGKTVKYDNLPVYLNTVHLYLTTTYSVNPFVSLPDVAVKLTDHEVACNDLTIFISEIIDELVIEETKTHAPTRSDIALSIARTITQLGKYIKLDLLSSLSVYVGVPCPTPSISLITWYCTVICALSPSQLLTDSSCISYNLILLFGLSASIERDDAKCENISLSQLIDQSCASLVNKSFLMNDLTDITDDITVSVKEMLKAFRINWSIMLWILRGAMLARAHDIAESCFSLLTQKSELLSSHRSLIGSIKALFSKIDGITSEENLFPNQNPLYHQKLYYVLVQKYAAMHTDDDNCAELRTIALEIYVHLCINLEPEILRSDLKNVLNMIVPWLENSCQEGNANSESASVTSQLQIKVISLLTRVIDSSDLLPTDTVIPSLEYEPEASSIYLSIENIANIVMTVMSKLASNNGLNKLSGSQRLSFTSILVWFQSCLPKEETEKWQPKLRLMCRQLARDPKKYIRMRAAQMRLLML